MAGCLERAKESNELTSSSHLQVAREIELQASLQHPRIVQIYAAFKDNTGIYVHRLFSPRIHSQIARRWLLSCSQVAREIELQASLQHPSIVQIYAAFEDNEGIYVVQEFALGGDLYAQLAQAGGYLAEAQVACEVMVPVLAALGYMHDKVCSAPLSL